MKNKTLSYISIIVSILVVAILGSVFVNLGLDWFAMLDKPSQFVPTWLIPVVWTVIYIVFAIILCIYVNKDLITKKLAILSIINGILNILWCLVFFTFNLTFLGQVVIVLNLVFAFWLVKVILEQGQAYSYITLIYPIWVSIATTLNLALWILN